MIAIDPEQITFRRDGSVRALGRSFSPDALFDLVFPTMAGLLEDSGRRQQRRTGHIQK